MSGPVPANRSRQNRSSRSTIVARASPGRSSTLPIAGDRLARSCTHASSLRLDPLHQQFDPAAGGLVREDSRIDYARIVEDQQVAGTQQIRQVRESRGPRAALRRRAAAGCRSRDGAGTCAISSGGRSNAKSASVYEGMGNGGGGTGPAARESATEKDDPGVARQTGARSRNRTDMTLRPRDFESLASTNFAIRAALPKRGAATCTASAHPRAALSFETRPFRSN